MTHHITTQEEKIVRNWIYEVRNDRITYPHGVPFEDALKVIEKLLDHTDTKTVTEFKSTHKK